MVGILLVVLLVSIACNLSMSGAKTPTISVLAPLQGSTFSVGETILVSFRAEANQTIARVEMTLDGTLIASQQGGASPFEGVFMWSPQDSGNYNLIVTAIDSDGEASAPAGVSVIVEAAVVEAPEDLEEVEETDEPEVEQAEPTETPDMADQVETVESAEAAEPTEQQPVEQGEIFQPLAPFYLTEGGYFDFDYASGIHGGAVIADQPDPALPEINFWNDHISVYEMGLFGLWGEFEPTFGDCRAAAISDVEIPSQHLTVGTRVCFQTDLGNFGYFTVIDRFLDSNGDLVLGFDYVMWDADGSELPVDPALHTISGTTHPQGIKGKDLDYYRNIRQVDVTFEAVSDTLINVVPGPNAQIAAWGSEMPTYQDCADAALGSQPVPVELEPVPEAAPVKTPTFVCYRTDEGRLGRLYIRWVYLGYLSAPLPYGDPWAHADFMVVYTGDGILVEFIADTWALPDETASSLIPQRAVAVANTGRLVVPFGGAIDFDLGTTLADSRSAADIEFLADESTQRAHLAPWYEDILLAAWGDAPPSFEDCQSVNLASTPIFAEIGQFVCFKTSSGRFGSYQVNDFYFDLDSFLNSNAEFYVDLNYTLWSVDGQWVVIHQPVNVLRVPDEWLLPGAYDLDMELGALSEDFTFEVINQNQVQLIPAAGVGLAYWGLTLPKLQDCESLTLGSESLSFEISEIQNYDDPGYQKMVIPAFYCYQTDEGRMGRLEFEGIYENTEAGLTYLLISAETWHLDDDAFSASQPVGDLAQSEPPEEMGSEIIPDEQGVIKSGQVRLPNVVAYDFVSEKMDQENFSNGDLIVEYNPDGLEGCFVSIVEPGGTMLGPYPDDFASIDVSQLGGFTTGCLPIELDGVYILIRQGPPGDYVIFRVTALDAEGITLDYIVGVYP